MSAKQSRHVAAAIAAYGDAAKVGEALKAPRLAKPSQWQGYGESMWVTVSGFARDLGRSLLVPFHKAL